MKNWKMVKMGDILKQVKTLAEINPDKTYKQVTIKMNRKGVVLRGTIEGSEIGSKQFLAKENQFIISRIDARNGAYGIVPRELDNAVVTNDFLLFDTSDQVDIAFLNYFSNTNFFSSECKRVSEGTTNRVRLKIDKFLEIKTPFPPLPEQRRIASKLEAVRKKIAQVKRLRAEQEKMFSNLLFSKYRDVVEGANWKEMERVAPLVRREVKIEETASFPELGVRSFGKGTFHKPALSGIEVGTKRIYSIEPGDLIFSNVFAWEGAIAVATKADEGRYGSHRFITCVTDENEVLPEFLCYYFLTEKGLEDINAASPGGAGRNKTLGLKKLKKIKVPLPDIEKQQEFLELKAKMERLAGIRRAQLLALEGVFPGLLDRAFRGEL